MTERMYHVVSFRCDPRTGEKLSVEGVQMTHTPVTHREACTIRSKLTSRPNRRLDFVEAHSEETMQAPINPPPPDHDDNPDDDCGLTTLAGLQHTLDMLGATLTVGVRGQASARLYWARVSICGVVSPGEASSLAGAITAALDAASGD